MKYKCTGCKCSCILEMNQRLNNALILQGCPSLLGEAHWVPVTEVPETVTPCVKKEQCPAQDFDIDSIFMYNVSDLDHIARTRTRNRLRQIKDVGMSYFNGEFFIKDTVSGLYIERVWDMQDSEFVSYMQWVKQVVKEKTGK